MLAKIVQIGSSKGIRIPKVILEQCNFSHEVNITVDKKRLIIEPIKKTVRNGWREAFRADKQPMSKKEKIEYIPTKFDDEWEW
ncbi:MAG: AbrB/MazE/SpoVT family DNA-binding domain-containing protein [Pseudomonadota bacterium]